MDPTYNPWATPLFPNTGSAFGVGSPAEAAERQPTFVDHLLSHIAGALGRGFMAPGNALNSTEPITTEQMIKPAADIAGSMTLGAGAIPADINALRMGIKAYHGSPHDFDRFDISKIGTGEGAQAYGHGLYFAENEATAKAYRDALAGKDTLAGYNAQLKALSKEMEQYSTGQYGKYNDPRGYELKRQYDAVMDARAADKGKMYEVNLNADPAHLLDWDKPLSQQSGYINDKLKRVFDQSLEGREAYQSLIKDRPGGGGGLSGAGIQLGATPEAASGRFNATGIPGIRYLDQGSRSSGQGSSNYVMFNDKLIDILRKYGIAGMTAPPIFANAMGEQKQ